MGLKDHVEDGAGRILDLGLDFEYLHVEGANRGQAGVDLGPSMEQGEEEESSSGRSSISSSTPGEAEESTGSDSEPELGHNSTASHPDGGRSVLNTHQPLCRTPCIDLGSEGPPPEPGEALREYQTKPPPEPLGQPAGPVEGLTKPPLGQPAGPVEVLTKPPLGQPVGPGEGLTKPPPQPLGQPAESEEVLKEYQTKLEFALKLGYTEETVRLVLAKLGPDTLINDILGELVKLGSKAESEQATGSTISQPTSTSSFSSCSSSSSSTCGFSDSLDGHRSDSPCPTDLLGDKDNLRPVVLDGSNVAMSHGNKEVFSCHGIQLAVDWFLERGHRDVTVFVPAWRKEQSRPDALITDQEILRRLEKEKILVFTPSRRVQGRRVVCYDDRFIVKLAYESDGIIVSNDNYRDLANEKPEWKKLIDERLLMYSFVNDKFMPPDDPLGRHGPSLDNFLRKRPIMPEHKKQPCPYGKKCTYGHKCKYYHPERSAHPQRSVADELRASAKSSTTPAAAKGQGENGLVKSHSVPACASGAAGGTRRAVPKRQSDPSIRALSYSEAEDRLLDKGRTEDQKNSLCSSSGSSSSSSNSSSSGGSVTMSPAPGGPSSALGYPQDQPHRVPPPLHHPDLYSAVDPPDLSYYSVTRAYSGLSLAARRSPSCRLFPGDTDLRLGSAGMAAPECSGESSASCGSSCDSYGERACLTCSDPLTQDSLQYPPHHLHHHHHHHQHHQQHSQHLYPHHTTALPEPPHLHPAHNASLCTPSPALHGYHQSLARGHSYNQDEPPEPHLKRPLYPLPQHLQHQALGTRSSCPGDYPPLPQTAPHPPGSPLGRCLASTRVESVSDSRLFERSPSLHSQKAFSSWDPYYRQSRYEPPACQSLPESRQPDWHTPTWGHTTHASHAPPPPHPSHGPHPSQTPHPNHNPYPPYPSHTPHPPHPSQTSHPSHTLHPPPLPHPCQAPHQSHAPPPPHPSYAPYTPHPSNPPMPPQHMHQEPPGLGPYGDMREKVYGNLCNIFPSELVGRVMGRSPHITDAQQLAAAILAEKSQSAY